jgi:hypothetical protein
MPKKTNYIWLFIISLWVVLKVNLKTRTKTYKMPKSIDFYLAYVWKGK